jgi:hypothetical protein
MHLFHSQHTQVYMLYTQVTTGILLVYRVYEEGRRKYTRKCNVSGVKVATK